MVARMKMIDVSFGHAHIALFIKTLKDGKGAVKHSPIIRSQFGYSTSIWGNTSFVLLHMTDTDLVVT